MESGDLENRDFLSTSSRESLTDELNWTKGSTASRRSVAEEGGRTER
jgi:hypothetical protein